MEKLTWNREGNLVGENWRTCSDPGCGDFFKITSRTVTLCPPCNSNRVKSTDDVSKMLLRAKARCKKNGLEFEITYEDITIPDICPILEIPLKCHHGSSGGKSDSPSLDRINNSKGYVKGNVRVISLLANVMKSSADDEQLVKFAQWALQEHGS